MGIDPKVWGPSAWNLIHTIAFRVASQNDTVSYNMAKHIYYSFLYILPCDKCRKNYDQHIIHLPIPESTEELPRWTYALHKRVSGDNYSWAAAKQRWSGREVDLNNFRTFLDAIAMTHPTARNIDSVYRDNLYNFLRGVEHFTHELPKFNKDMLSSRHLFKMWLKKIKSKSLIHIRKCDKNICST